MSAIVLLDTSVYLNVLDVPGNNQNRDAVFEEFDIKIRADDRFLLPFATILETGNHIADLPSGRIRRQFAQKLVDNVNLALQGDAPFRPTQFPSRDEFLGWLSEFPDYAMRSKTSRKPKEEGVSLTDLSIIKEWQRTCNLHSMSRVLIWSLDSDLAGYDRIP
jgi:hypothetical protein